MALRHADGATPLSATDLEAVKDAPSMTVSELKQTDAYKQSFTVKSAEAIAIFALLPPPPSEATKSAPKSPLQRWLARTVAEVEGWVGRIAWATTMFPYGLPVPIRALAWMAGLRSAAVQGDDSPIMSKDCTYHDLQVMCVAKHLQGTGVGSAVMQEVYAHARANGVQGMKGLCQSEQTRRFYEKSGFKSDLIIEHARGWRGPGTVRKHWLIAWTASDHALQ